MSSGASLFANGLEAPQARNRSGDTPSSLKQFLRNKLIYNFTKDYATPKIPGAREKTLPATGAEPRPVREPLRASRALQTNSTQ